MIAIEQQRQDTFERYVETFPFREIVDRRRLEHYIATGIAGVDACPVDRAIVREHVLHVIDLLRRQSNYHLALSDQPFEDNFAVKPDFAILLERRKSHGEYRLNGIYNGILDMDLETVAEFTRRFEVAWNAIPAELKENQRVSCWLETLLEASEGQSDTDIRSLRPNSELMQ